MNRELFIKFSLIDFFNGEESNDTAKENARGVGTNRSS